MAALWSDNEPAAPLRSRRSSISLLMILLAAEFSEENYHYIESVEQTVMFLPVILIGVSEGACRSSSYISPNITITDNYRTFYMLYYNCSSRKAKIHSAQTDQDSWSNIKLNIYGWRNFLNTFLMKIIQMGNYILELFVFNKSIKGTIFLNNAVLSEISSSSSPQHESYGRNMNVIFCSFIREH